MTVKTLATLITELKTLQPQTPYFVNDLPNLESYLSLPIYPKWYVKKPNGECVLALGKQEGLEKAMDEPGHSEILKRVDGKSGKWFGCIGFSESFNRQWKDVPQEWFIRPYVLMESSNGVTTITLSFSEEKLENDYQEITAILEKLKDNAPITPSEETPKFREKTDTPQFQNWKNTVVDVIREIESGRYEKCVLARLSILQFTHDISHPEMFSEISKKQINCYHSFVSLNSNMAWISFSPEVLYTRHHKAIISMALAGTKPRGKTTDEDEALESELLQSKKERNEHRCVAEFVQNQLTPFCETLTSTGQEKILKQQHVQHVVHHFEGELKDNVSDWDIVSALHPTPAVCGFPRDRAFESIRRNEPFDRGWYAGILGSVSAEETEWVVGIRSALIKNKAVYVYAGAGIVRGSEADKEWQEIDEKMKPYLEWAEGK